MSKYARFIPVIYMLFCMTFSISMIHYLMGHGDNFFSMWLMSFVIAAPLALFFSMWIGPIMKRIGGAH